MNKERLQKLLISYSSNRIQANDYNELMDYVTASNYDDELYAFMEKVWNSRPVEKSFSDMQSDLLYQRIIGDRRFDRLPVHKKSKYIKLWQSIAAAAVILITISVGLFFYADDNTFTDFGSSELAKIDIKGGGNNAVLTLADGRKIELTNVADGQIAEQSGLSIRKTADGQIVYEVSSAAKVHGKEEVEYNIISTPKGGQYQVNLPDGTRVWLNASTSLKFPTVFVGRDKRMVELKGEGYFEVAKLNTGGKALKSAKHIPFVVKTNDQEVEVLGTHFNISNYADDAETKTTLLEGAVKVKGISAMRDHAVNGVILSPGQQASLKAGQLNVKTVDLSAEVAWINGYFVFKDEGIRSIMRKIARWYDVEVVFSKDFRDRSFEGSISRFKNISEVLRKFELTGDIHFKIEERRITVMP